MSPVRITFEIDGKAQFDRVFRRLDENFKDLSPIWDDVRDAFWNIEEDQFQSEGAKGRSGRWAPLSPKYEKQKIARYGTFAVIAGVLIASENLYKSMTRETAHTVYRKDKKSMTVGTNLPYAAYHQRGAGRLPKREIISLSEKNKKDLQKSIQESLVKHIRRSGVYVDTEGDV